MNPEADEPTACGVEALLQRLRDEGVAAGRAEAEKIVAEAQARAEWLVNQAQEEAEQLREKARADAERFKSAAEGALGIAARDALLTLRARLTQRFSGEVRRLVAGEVKKKEILQQLILEVVGRIKEPLENAAQRQVLLPRDVVGLEQLRRQPEELGQDELSQLVKEISRDMIRGEGITFAAAEDELSGLRVRLVEEDIVLDMSDRAIADLLLEHLQPRFRALLEGIVK
jgi:V/A-type H+-transporting ATPase subunit E